MSSIRFVSLLVFVAGSVGLLGMPDSSGEPPDRGERVKCSASYRQLAGSRAVALLVGCEEQLRNLGPDVIGSTREVVKRKIRDHDLGLDLIREVNQILSNAGSVSPNSCIYIDLGSRTEVYGDMCPLRKISGEHLKALLFGDADLLKSLSKHEIDLAIEALQRTVDEEGLRLLGKEDDLENRQRLVYQINKVLERTIVSDIFLRDYIISEPL